VGALLVDRRAAGHAERDDDGAAVSLDEVLRGDGEVLEARAPSGDDLKVSL
jgi:hypothetical protein